MKILVVGGVAGGASVAARARRIDENAEVIMFERGPHVSFSNCSLPFHLSGLIEDSDSLVLMQPEGFVKKYKIDARVNQEVIAIDPEKKTVRVKKLLTGEEYEENYDKLALSPGSNAILPRSIEGINSDNVFIVKNVVDIKKLQKFIVDNDVQELAVVGGGFIGLEVAENLVEAGKKVHLIEAISQVMAPLDFDMAQIVHKELYDHGVDVLLEERLVAIKDGKAIMESGKEVKAEAVVMSIGVLPETTLAKQCGIELGKTGAILVNHNYQTNYPDIYAVGDAIEVTHRITGKKTKLALAGPAQRQARAAADHMFGKYHEHKGVIGSSCIHLFDLNVANTGLNERVCKELGYNYDSFCLIPFDMVEIIPASNPLYFKIVYEVPTGRILGAQAVGRGNVDKRIDVIATMISMGGTLEDLKELELCYSPYYGTARDVVNQAALVGLNLLHEDFKKVRVTEVRGLVESGAYIVDVREKDEYDEGHVTTAVNIPMSEFRERSSEIPKDIPVYLYCRSSQRAYNVVRALQNLGWNNVRVIEGSFLGISTYEYFLDQITGRDKIVTAYNFD